MRSFQRLDLGLRVVPFGIARFSTTLCRGVLHEALVRLAFSERRPENLPGRRGRACSFLSSFFHIDTCRPAGRNTRVVLTMNAAASARLFRDRGPDVRSGSPSCAAARRSSAMVVLVDPMTYSSSASLCRQVALLADVPHGRDGLFEQFDAVRAAPRRSGGGVRAARATETLSPSAPRRHVLPDFLGDERHERMQRPEQPVEERFRSVHRRPVGRLPVARFHHFKVPSGEFVPEQACTASSTLPKCGIR